MSKFDPRFQIDIHDGFENCFSTGQNLLWSKKSHAIDEADQSLFIAVQRDIIPYVRAQEQMGRAHYKIRVDRLAPRHLGSYTLKPMLHPFFVDSRRQRGAASEKCPEQCCGGWKNRRCYRHSRLPRFIPCAPLGMPFGVSELRWCRSAP